MENSFIDSPNKSKPKVMRVTTVDLSLERLLEGQLKYLNQYYDVIGIASDTGLLEKVGLREHIRVINVPMKRNISILWDFKCLLILIKIFRKEHPYIVHSNTPKGSLLSMLAAKITKVPHRIYTVTGLRYQGETGLLRLLLMKMERITCWCANEINPEGEGVKKTLLQDKITTKALFVIHNGNINGIDTSYYSQAAVKETKREIRELNHLKDNDFIFVYVGRIVREKGLRELIYSMKRLKKEHPITKLIIVGNFEQELDPLSKEDISFLHKDPCIRYVGYRSDVRPYLKASDVFILPSYREGFPNSVLQAGAMDLPCIVTDVNGCNEIIKNQENGIIIPPKDKTALYEAMNYCLENAESIKRYSQKARKNICEKYERTDVWNSLIDYYNLL